MLTILRFTCCAVIAAGAAAAEEIQIEPGPGGNIVVQRVDGQTVFVAPDQRDIQKGQWWFYWSFQLKAAPAQPVTIVFSGQNPLGVRGPAMSLDGGATWQWLGAASVKSFQHEGKSRVGPALGRLRLVSESLQASAAPPILGSSS